MSEFDEMPRHGIFGELGAVGQDGSKSRLKLGPARVYKYLSQRNRAKSGPVNVNKYAETSAY